MTTRQWLVATNGTYDFNNPADWQFGAVPSAIDIAQFSTGVVDTITGNATIAGIVVGSGNFALAGTYAISGTQPTELTVNGSLTILPGASVIGNQAVSVSGGSAFLSVQGTLVASSLSIVGGALDVYQGASFDVSGPITIGNFGGLTGLPAPNQNARSAVAIDNAIQTSGTIFLGSLGQQEIDFNGIISGSGL